MADNLTQMRICVEKPLRHEEHIMKHLSNSAILSIILKN